MKIAVLNGSPKGEHSITLTYLHYVRTRFPEHEYIVIHVARDIAALERQAERFDEVMATIAGADAVLWLYGAWVLLVPAQLLRFIELVHERKREQVFAGTYGASISTSIHYLDHFAEHYIRAESEDLGMRYVDQLGLDIRDVMNPKARANICRFFEYFTDAVARRRAVAKHTSPLGGFDVHYEPAKSPPQLDGRGKRILILSDATTEECNLSRMTKRFAERFGASARIVNIADLRLKGGCRGCMRCGRDNNCVYRDGFQEFYNSTVREADIVIFAATVTGRFLSSTFKTFLDRAYFWTHTPSLAGKTIGYLIEGPLARHLNTRQFLEASVTARQHALFAGIITDECADSGALDALIDDFAGTCLRYAVDGYAKGGNFLFHGAHKVFRDYNWEGIRLIWQADHRFYKKHGLYDFPGRSWLKNLVLSAAMLFTRIPAVRKKIDKHIGTMPASRLRRFIDVRLSKERSAHV